MHRDDTLLGDGLLLDRLRWHAKTILERRGAHGGHLGNDAELAESAAVDLLSLRDDPVDDRFGDVLLIGHRLEQR